MSDALLRCWGSDKQGQLGDGANADQHTPVPLTNLFHTTAISAGQQHVCAIGVGTDQGKVFCWGLNAQGQLGDGTTTNRNIPNTIPAFEASVVSSGAQYTCAITNTSYSANGVACWGDNTYGQLGDTTTTPRSSPTPVAIADVLQIAVGDFHACARTSTDGVLCWGHNETGELGDDTQTDRHSPFKVGSLGSVTSIGVGNAFTCAVMTDTSVQCWGDNAAGQLGDGTTSNRGAPAPVKGLTGVETLVLGGYTACAIMAADGSVECWGALPGAGSTASQPTAIGSLGIAVKQVAIGDNDVCSLDKNDVVRCWGENDSGQLGNGTTFGSFTPTPVKWQ